MHADQPADHHRTTLELRPLDLGDDAQVRRVHEIGWRAEKEDGRAWNDFWTYDELARVLREPTGDMQTDAWCAFDGDRMVGAGVVELSLLDNLDKAFVFPVVEPELRGRGIGGFVLDGLLDQVRRQRRPHVLGATAVPYAERDSSVLLRFAQRHGFEVANVEVVRSLPLPEPDGLLAGPEPGDGRLPRGLHPRVVRRRAARAPPGVLLPPAQPARARRPDRRHRLRGRAPHAGHRAGAAGAREADGPHAPTSRSRCRTARPSRTPTCTCCRRRRSPTSSAPWCGATTAATASAPP